MDINVYLFIVIALMLLIIMYLLFVLRRVRTQLALIKDALEDIKGGNLNRRILAGENDMTKTICYDINKIAVNSQAQLIRQRQSEQAYKRLMTSLSHDVKTPLASLVGYLEAVENKIVIGEEKDEYIHVAHEKAHYMKSFVENLFEWVKLDSGEQIFHFEKFDLNELSRNIIADWIPVLESNHFEYEFVIPETEYFIHIDVNAYTRVLNNLFQNIIILPVVLGLVSTMLMYDENQNDMLKQLWIIPISKTGYFFSKFIVVLSYSVCFMLLTAIASVFFGMLPGYITFEWNSISYLFKKCIEIAILTAFSILPLLAVAAAGKNYILPVCVTLVYTFLSFILLMVNMYLHPLSSATAIIMRDIPGVILAQEVNIPAALFCIGIWTIVSIVFAYISLKHRK